MTASSPDRPPTDSATPRVLLYSHDSYGLGHLRRSMTLAAALRQSLPEASVLIATGSPCATHFAVPPGVDMVKLPSVTKDEAGRYVPRTLSGSLKSLLRLRSALVEQLFETFQPHLFVVDHQVAGLLGELLPVLRRARDQGTRTVLGLRDIIDEPAAVRRDWARDHVLRAFDEGYDQVYVYGSPTVFDPRSEYDLPDSLSDRVQFTGYVVRPAPQSSTRPLPADRPQVLVTMGGGEDGGERVETYLAGLQRGPVEWDSTVVLGPLLDPASARAIKRQARLIDGVTVHLFHSDLPRLLSEADAVVAMAGYNTVAEVLQSGLPAILLPRCFPRREQSIRAERLSRLDLAEAIEEPDPASLREAVQRALLRPRRRTTALPLDGAARMADLTARLLGMDVAPAAPLAS